MIRLARVSKQFASGAAPVQALIDVDLEVPKGCIFGVIGGSGAGKSTLIRCVNLLERPSSGKVFVDGRELTDLPPRELASVRRAIGMIFQQPNLLASRTVAANVALPLELARASKARIEARVAELLALVGVSDKQAAYPAQLSGGQRQRVTIARALATEPKVLLCDEATSALDPATTRSILTLLRDINQRLGVTILLISHEMDVVKSMCDHVAVLSGGRLVEQGTALSIFARSSSEAARKFIRGALELDLPEAYRARLSPTPGPGTHPVLRIELTGRTGTAALISQLSRELQIDVALISSRTDHADGAPFGVLLVELVADENAVGLALEYLRAHGASLEVMGYVA